MNRTTELEHIVSQERDGEYTEFTMRVRMRSRWVNHFLAMLKKMQRYGGLGSSRYVAIYSDGDGDFRPQFEWPEGLPSNAEPVSDDNGNVTYDAG